MRGARPSTGLSVADNSLVGRQGHLELGAIHQHQHFAVECRSEQLGMPKEARAGPGDLLLRNRSGADCLDLAAAGGTHRCLDVGELSLAARG